MRYFFALPLSFFLCVAARAGDLTIHVPPATEVTSATATAREMKLDADGSIKAADVTFSNLLPDTPYNIKLTLSDGIVLQGVDLSWYNDDPARTDAGELSDDDRREITKIVTGIHDFYNNKSVLMLSGDHDRATALVQLVRDTSFHSDKGDEVIWRAELWYFRNEHGGWAAISQQNKVLRRERFQTHQQFQKVTQNLKWMPELGGVVCTQDKPNVTIILPKPQGDPATRPAPPAKTPSSQD